jgi:hypothetical protein
MYEAAKWATVLGLQSPTNALLLKKDRSNGIQSVSQRVETMAL